MQDRIKYFGIFLFIACFASAFFIAVKSAAAISAPTIIRAEEAAENAKRKLRIEGVVVSGLDVLVYLNGEYLGTAAKKDSGSLTDDFYFEKEVYSSLPYELAAVARDPATQELSSLSNKAKISAPYIFIPGAPTLIAPFDGGAYYQNEFKVSGLARSGFNIQIFIDEALRKETGFLEHKSGTAGFQYYLTGLAAGRHSVKARAKGRNDELGAFSPQIFFTIIKTESEEPESGPGFLGEEAEDIVAPFLFKAAIDKEISPNRPQVSGQGMAGSRIQIYVDDILDGEINLEGIDNGAAEFEYFVNQELSPGKHSILAYSTNKKGEKSPASNAVAINIEALDKGEISPEAAEEENVDVKGYVEGYPEETGKGFSSLEEIEEILNQDKGAAEASGSGLISESKGRLSQLRWNLLIFILFLTAVIGWIFWVNRELIRERREENKKVSGKNEEKKENEPDILDF